MIIRTEGSISDLARAFTAEGLANAHVSEAKVEAARSADAPLTWKLGVTAGESDPFSSRTQRLIAKYIHDEPYAGPSEPPGGLRLVAPLRWRTAGRGGVAAIGRILDDPGYQAAVETSGADSGLKSFAIDAVSIPGLPEAVRKVVRPIPTPAFSWPIRLDANDNVAAWLDDNRAAYRGFVDLQPGRSNAPVVAADLVSITEGHLGDYLALRFLGAGLRPRRLPEHVSLAELARLEPLVLLPLTHGNVSDVLTGFVYELAHNLPVDVAAWQAMRNRRLHGDAPDASPPLVLASPGFLRHAQLSDTIAGLQARLRRLDPDRLLELAPDDLQRFNVQRFRDSDLPRPTPQLIEAFLNQPGEFEWFRESDSAAGLLAITRAVTDLERGPDTTAVLRSSRRPSPAASAPPPAPSAPASPAPTPAAPVEAAPDDDVQLSAPAASPEPASERRLRTTIWNRFDLDRAPLPSPVPKAAPVVEPDSAAPEPAPSVTESAPMAEAAPAAAEPPPAEPEVAVPPPPPPRYTNVKLFDDARASELANTNLLIAEQSYVLDVSIATLQAGLAARPDQPPAGIKDQTEDADVWVVISDETDRGNDREGDAFRFDRCYANFVLPVVGDSRSSATFRITPTAAAFASGGKGEIGIRLYHKLNLIDHLDLAVSVAADAAHVPAGGQTDAIAVTFRRAAHDVNIEAPDKAMSTRVLNIAISRKRDSNLYRFAYVLANRGSARPDQPGLVASKVLTAEALDDFVSQFRKVLLATVFGPSLQKAALTIVERDALLKKLSVIGSKIFTQIFEYEAAGDLAILGYMIRDAMLDKQSGLSTIQIALSEDARDLVFPWQILTLADDKASAVDPQNLWGFRFIIEVKRLRDGIDRRSQAARQRSPVQVRYGRWNFINEPDHYIFLQQAVTAACGPVQLADPVIELEQQLNDALAGGGGDLLYLYAHGRAAAPSTSAGIKFNTEVRQQILDIAEWLKQDLTASATKAAAWTDTYQLMLKTTENATISSLALKNATEILLTDIITLRGPAKDLVQLRDAPIVFLNTCESAQLWNALEGSFVGFFLKRGARAVLGTESTIPVVVADLFGRTVLERMFAGQTLGEAVKAARDKLLTDKNNPLGLCYSIYGIADARLFENPVPQRQQGASS